MGLTVGELFVRIKADQSGLNQGLDEAKQKSASTAASIGRDWDDLRDKLDGIGTKMTMAVTLPILGLGTAAVKLASDLSETMNKIDVIYGESADEVKKWAETSITSMGLAKQTALDMTALYGDMGTSMGFTAKAAGEMGMQLTQRAADMASFKNIQIDIAKTALNGIFSGETESLKQLGVVMTVANLNQYAFEQGLEKTYEQMTQNEQVTLRYNYVMEKTATSAGDFARTSDGVANQTRMAGEQIKELGAAMGSILLPAAAKLLKGVNELIGGFIDLPESQKKAIITTLGIVAAIGPAIKLFTLTTKAVKGVAESFQNLGKLASAVRMGTIVTGNTAAATSANALALANAKVVASEAAVSLSSAKAAAAKAAYALATLQATAGATAEQIAMAKTVAAQTALAVTGAQAAVAEASLGVSSAGAAVGVTAGGVAAGLATPPTLTLGAAIQFALGPLAIIGGLLAIAIPLIGALGIGAGHADPEVKKLGDSIAAANTEFNDNIDKVEQDAVAAERLAEKLDILQKKTNLTSTEKLELKKIVGQLNKLYPELALEIDKVTGKLKNNNIAIKDVIKSKKEEMLQGLYLERMNRALDDQLTLETRIADKTKEVADAYTEMMKPRGFEFHFGWEEDDITKWKRLKDELAEYNTQMTDTIAVQDMYGDKWVESAEVIDDATTQTMDDLKAQQEALEEQQKAIEDMTQEHLDDMGTIEDNGIKQNKIRAKTVARNLQEQIDDYTTWSDEMAKLSKTAIPADMLKELEELGPEYTQLIKDLNKKDPKQLQEFIDLWAERGKLAKEEAVKEIGGVVGEVEAVMSDTADAVALNTSIKNEATYLGVTIVDGLITGMNSRTGSLLSTARSLASQAMAAMKSEIQPGSPSKVTTAWGRNMAEGLELGMTQKSDLPVRAARDLSLDTLTALSGADATTRRAAALAAEAGAAMATPRSSSTKVQHSGTIRVEGINSRDQLEAVIDVVMDKLQVEHLQAGLR
jgi:hypothetical protein